MKLFLLVLVALSAPAAFREHTIATGLKGGYQVVPCDVNHDGKVDLIALSSGMTDLVWYENPGWQPHILAHNLPRLINLAPYDIDGDGIPEIAIAYEFSMNARDSIGIVAILEHRGDPRGLWTLREIDRLPTSHRLRWADIDGSGHKVLVNAPLTGTTAQPPDYRQPVPLVYYRPGDWKRHLISDANGGVQHGIAIVDWDADGRDAILTASFGGIHLYQLPSSGEWRRTELTRGDPAPWPKSGTSDIAVGRIGKDRFLAAIEPWHGNQVAAYRHNGTAWSREVIDNSLADGHTVVTADFDGDGNDEIVAGFRGQGQSVYVYRWDGKLWNRATVDGGGIAAAACAVADLNGDGKLDVTCIGSATQNLKWYENK